VLAVISVLLGVIVAGAGVATLWYFLPTDGAVHVHRLVTKPFLDWLIPIVILTALSIGVALVVSGVVG
jgi:hypothetical protein